MGRSIARQTLAAASIEKTSNVGGFVSDANRSGDIRIEDVIPLSVLSAKLGQAAVTSPKLADSLVMPGNVTKPSQVSFLVRRLVFPAGLTHAQTGNADPFAWDQISQNIGSGFNLSANKFTAPLTGFYFFGFQIGARGSGGSPTDLFTVTLVQTPAGNSLESYHDSTGIQSDTCQFSALTYVPAGEQVYLKVAVGGAGLTWGDCLDKAGWFTGTLIN